MGIELMIERPQWMLWKMEGGTKIPYQTNGRRAKSNDPETWCNYHDAKEAFNKNGGYSGIAFVFSKDDPLCGVDLDDCIVDGEMQPWAKEIVDRFAGVAYGEISPSGTGVKLTTMAKKPDGSLCSSGGGVECYDRSRFWTVTGDCLGDAFTSIGDGQEAIDWVVAKHLTRQIQPQQPPQHTFHLGSSSVLERAIAYADAIPQTLVGNLRNTAFKLAGNLHAIVGEYGERLGDNDVLSLLERWNARNPQPLRLDELQEAAVNGRKNGTPPPAKLPSVQVVHPTLVAPSPAKTTAVPTFPKECLRPPGLLSQIVDYTIARSLYPQQELAVAGAIALMSTITGRKVRDEYGTRTNLYLLGLAPSGSGKEQARKTNKELLYLSGHERLVGPERIASSAGLVSFVRDRLSPLFQLDEIGRMLATMRGSAGYAPHLFNIGTVLMQLYSSSDQTWIGDAYADQKQTPTIIQPHATVYGTSVPVGFWDGLDASSLADGLLARMLVFESPGYVSKKRPEVIEPPEDLLQSLRWWADFKPAGPLQETFPQQQTIPHQDAARERFEAHLDGIDERKRSEGSVDAALWSRTGEKVAKLALIFACSRNPERADFSIETQDVDLAIKLANYLTRLMLYRAGMLVAENAIDGAKKRLFAIVADAPGRRIRLNDLTRRTQWLRRRDRDEYLGELVESGTVQVIPEPSGSGRPGMWVVAL